MLRELANTLRSLNGWKKNGPNTFNTYAIIDNSTTLFRLATFVSAAEESTSERQASNPPARARAPN